MIPQQYNAIFYHYGIFSAFLLIILVVIIIFTAFIRYICCRRRKWSQSDLTTYDGKWKRIKYLSGKEDTRPLAIINACSLLDHTLKTKGYHGETLFERFASAHSVFGNSKNQIFKVIQLRNRLAHEATMGKLDKEKTDKDLQIIHQALFDLNAYV